MALDYLNHRAGVIALFPGPLERDDNTDHEQACAGLGRAWSRIGKTARPPAAAARAPPTARRHRGTAPAPSGSRPGPATPGTPSPQCRDRQAMGRVNDRLHETSPAPYLLQRYGAGACCALPASVAVTLQVDGREHGDFGPQSPWVEGLADVVDGAGRVSASGVF